MPRSITPSGISLTQFGTREELLLPSHTHHRPVLVLLGSGGLEQAGAPGVLRAGGVRLAPAGARHDLRLWPDTNLIVVECEPTGVAGAHPVWRQLTTGTLLPPGAVPPLALAAAVRGAGGMSFAVEDGVLRFLAATSRWTAGLEPRPLPATLATVVHGILSEPARRIRLGDIARGAGVHRVQLGRWAREFLGRPLWHVAMSARLEVCRCYLLSSSMSLAGIAEVAGFCDQSHLNRAFRRRFGVSPGNFRRMFQASKTRTPARAMVPG